MPHSQAEAALEPEDIEKLARWEKAVELAEKEGLVTVLRGAGQAPGSRYVPAAIKLAAVLRAAQDGEPPELRARARRLWDRACGLSKPGGKDARGAMLSEWFASILDAESPAIELFENLQRAEFVEGSVKESELLDLLRKARKQPLMPRTLPVALTLEHLTKMKRNALFVVIEAMLRVDKEPGYRFGKKLNGGRVRKKYERHHRKSDPKR